MLPQQLKGPVYSAQRGDDVALEGARQVSRMLSDGFKKLTFERQEMQGGRSPDHHGHRYAKICGSVPQLLKVGPQPLAQEVHSTVQWRIWLITEPTQLIRAGCLTNGNDGEAALLQRIAFTLIDRDGADRSWINTQSFRKGVFAHSVSLQQPWETVVSFDAARLGIYSVFFVVLQSEFLFGGPRPHPHSRIIDCYGIVKRGGAGPCP